MPADRHGDERDLGAQGDPRRARVPRPEGRAAVERTLREDGGQTAPWRISTAARIALVSPAPRANGAPRRPRAGHSRAAARGRAPPCPGSAARRADGCAASRTSRSESWFKAATAPPLSRHALGTAHALPQQQPAATQQAARAEPPRERRRTSAPASAPRSPPGYALGMRFHSYGTGHRASKLPTSQVRLPAGPTSCPCSCSDGRAVRQTLADEDVDAALVPDAQGIGSGADIAYRADALGPARSSCPCLKQTSTTSDRQQLAPASPGLVCGQRARCRAVVCGYPGREVRLRQRVRPPAG